MYKNVGIVFARDMEAGLSKLKEIEEEKKRQGILPIYKKHYEEVILFEDNEQWSLVNAMIDSNWNRWSRAYIDDTIPWEIMVLKIEPGIDCIGKFYFEYYNPEDYKEKNYV